MKALKLKLFQETACYTKPFARKVGETYPLPPYSTVIGMLHRVLEATTFHPMRVSVQGNYEDKFIDYRRTYMIKKSEVTTVPLNIHLLYNIELLIHVQTDEEKLNLLYERLQNNAEYLSLGRKEDLIRMDEVKLTDIHYCESEYEEYTLKNNIYIPVDALEEGEVKGIHYRLNTRYHLVNHVRKWEKVDVLYLSAGDTLIEDGYWMDDDNELVYFHSSH
ncbi:type I-B CRISPR-associated protein Cas5b [Thermoflavimicrobium daqui]|uniref:Type I-B CRISPR-associated protein Cas5 n=1 Tax=Thermoflavimicrobium daqui TaxID=2137476 RepID=A0A364K7B5_9BACL|nr:type I-B CRISPR-associated protein Cas5b [Thermoflavimicrobium daqui]RAL26191.1 type I-B CRISPR-associated protein Cas5 [Thermoflavimicrobium daqui]